MTQGEDEDGGESEGANSPPMWFMVGQKDQQGRTIRTDITYNDDLADLHARGDRLQIPAVCSTCDTAFGSGVEFDPLDPPEVDPSEHFTCPSCGGDAHIAPSNAVHDQRGRHIEIGRVRTVAAAASALLTSGLTADDLRQLADQLEGISQSASDEAAEGFIRRNPTLAPVARQPLSRGEWLEVVQIILAVIAILLAYFTANNGSGDVTVNNTTTIEQIVIETVETRPELVTPPGGGPPSIDQPAVSQPQTNVKIPRNAPCPCGSGAKYKLCCGR